MNGADISCTEQVSSNSTDPFISSAVRQPWTRTRKRMISPMDRLPWRQKTISARVTPLSFSTRSSSSLVSMTRWLARAKATWSTPSAPMSPRLGGYCHIDSRALQTSSDGRRNMFIQVEPDRARHGGPPAFLGAWKDTSASYQRRRPRLHPSAIPSLRGCPSNKQGLHGYQPGSTGGSQRRFHRVSYLEVRARRRCPEPECECRRCKVSAANAGSAFNMFNECRFHTLYHKRRSHRRQHVLFNQPVASRAG